MSGFTTNTIDFVIRDKLYTTQLKEIFEDDLIAMKYVNWITSFPDGDQWNQPSVGQAEVTDYAEDQPVKYTAMDTGNFTMTITDYVQSGTYMTNKIKQDSYISDQLMAKFIPEQNRAIMKDLEVKILKEGPTNQTAGNTNTINTAYHRFIGSGTNETISPVDFQLASFALTKANVPMTNLVAIVDPTVEVSLATLANIVNVSNNPTWEGIVRSGMTTGMRFSMSIFGWDIYVSNNLHKNTASESIDNKTVTAGVNNIFFSAAAGSAPLIGAIRQPVRVDTKYNMDFQRDEFVTTMRYGLGFHRPENFVTILTDTDQVYA